MPVPPPTFPHPILSDASVTSNILHIPSCQMPVPPPSFPHPILSDASVTSNIPTSHPVRCQCHLHHSHIPSCQMPVPPPSFPHPILSDASVTSNIPTSHPVRCQHVAFRLASKLYILPIPYSAGCNSLENSCASFLCAPLFKVKDCVRRWGGHWLSPSCPDRLFIRQLQLGMSTVRST